MKSVSFLIADLSQMQIHVFFSVALFQTICAIQSSTFLESSSNFLNSYLIALTQFSRCNWKINLLLFFLLPILPIPLISQRFSRSFHHLPRTELFSWLPHTCRLGLEDHCFLDLEPLFSGLLFFLALCLHFAGIYHAYLVTL